ncbi:MAG: tetratricopeptide repeat protein [Flavobacteriales bacterium]
MRSILTLALAGLFLLPTACNNVRNEPTSPSESAPAPAFAVPDLPRRTVELGVPDEYDHMRDAYDKSRLALAKNPNDLESWLRMSEVFITEARITGNYGSNFDAALSILDHVIAKSGADKARRGESLTLKAAVKLSQHQFAEALLLGKEAVALDPHRAFNYGVLVDANVELGNYEEAVRMSDKMVSTRPDLRSYSRISYLRELHGDVSGAIEAMEMAVQAGYPGQEETSWCRTTLGRLYENTGDLKNAEANYMTAITERPNYPPAMAAMGRLELKKKDPVKAEEWLKKAIALVPDAHYYMDLARVDEATHQAEARDAAMTKARETLIGLSGMDKSGMHAHGGDWHSHTTAVDDGMSHPLAAKGDSLPKTKLPDHGHSHEVGLEMGRFELEFGKNMDAALANGLHEYGLRPDNIDVNALLAGIYYTKGDLENAGMHLVKARRTGTKDAYTTCLAGLVALKSGDTKAGKALIAQAFKTDPYQMHVFAAEARGKQ